MKTRSSILNVLSVRSKGVHLAASVIAFGAISVGLASCGSSSSLANSQSTTTTGVSPQARASYQNCLISHGFTFPKFNPNAKTPPTTVPQAVRNAAIAACARLNGGGPGFTISKTQQKAILAYAACLKAHGVNVPTSSPGGGANLRALSQSAGFASASQACASLRPKFGGRGQASAGTNTATTAG